MSFNKEDTIIIPGNLEKIINYRIQGKFFLDPKYGNATVISVTEDIIENKDSNFWHRKVLIPLNINKILLSLLNVYSIKLNQDFYIDDNKLITKFSNPEWLSNFFYFNEEHIYEQLNENIKITRISKGINKIKSWLIFPLSLTNSGLVKETERNFHEQIIDLILAEVRNSI